MRPLYHYTCSHGAEGINASGVIRPFPQPFLGGVSLAWFTEDPDLSYDGLGLQSSVLLTCDRMEHRYKVSQHPFIIRWSKWAAVRRVPLSTVCAFGAGRAPGAWWVSQREVTASSVSRDRPPRDHQREAPAPLVPGLDDVTPRGGAGGGGRL